jgi:hypothetical protein
MKLVTFDDGRVGRLELEDQTVIELDVPSTREWFERGGEVPETGERLALADVRGRLGQLAQPVEVEYVIAVGVGD